MRLKTLNCALYSTRNLRKASYRILKKMHKLERRMAIRFSPKIGKKNISSLCIKHIINILNAVYDVENEESIYIRELSDMLDNLCSNIDKNTQINRPLLVACLKKHTRVFNFLKQNKIKIKCNDATVSVWNTKVVTAYVLQFKNGI